MIRSLAAPAAIVAFLSGQSLGQGPLTTSFSYQGELRQSGTPAAGTYDLRFRLYSAPAGGTQLGSTLCADNVQLSAGRFTIDLDFGAQFTGEQPYLEIDVRPDTGLDCSNATGYTTLSPRQPLTASPNALFSINAGSAGSATTAMNATQLNGQSAGFYQNAANLTSGAIPSARLSGTYASVLSLTNSSNAISGTFSGSGANLTGLNASNIGAGTLDVARLPVPLSLAANLSSATIRGETTSSDQNAAGVMGLASDPTGTGAAVVGQSSSPSGLAGYFQAPSVVLVASSNGDDAIRAYTPGAGKSAVAGFATSSSGGYGIYGQNNATAGAGIYGRAVRAASTTPGVLGESSSTAGRGVQGNATASTGVNYGGYFTSASFGGFALHAENTAGGTSAEIIGTLNATTHITGDTALFANGAAGQTTGLYARGSSFGVYGAGLGPYGVYGLASLGSYGVYADGNLGSNGVKSFRIDHPADPENKYLLHYCTESPEVLNAYSGKVILDGNGAATVQLPGYFAAINTDPRYTLTPIGAAMPMLHIASEIDDKALAQGNTVEPGQPIPACSFTIAGGAPGGKVSWRIEAVRNDRWVQRQGAPVEMDKPAGERGTYQRPELYGQPPERGMPAPAEHRAVEAMQHGAGPGVASR